MWNTSVINAEHNLQATSSLS